MYWNRATLQTNTERGSVVRDVPFVYITFLDTLIERRQCRLRHRLQCRRGSEANVTFERQRLHGEGGKGHDCRGRGTEASKEETDTTNDDRVQHCVQFRSGIQCDDQLGNSSAQRNFDTTITSVLSDNSSVAPICCGHPPEGKDESQMGKCSDDGRGPVKTLSGRLARKLQRSASLVNVGLSKQIQTVLDAATVDRCDFVEICCCDVPCLTEAMQRRGLSSFSLPRSDGIGNHDAQTREKIFGWLTENRPQKAASVGRLWSYVNSELNRKAVVENCL